MKHLKYIWRSVTRNKLRSLLTIFSVCFSLAMMTVLYGYVAMQEAWSTEASQHNRVVVMNIQGFSGMVPIAYVDRIRRMDGVSCAVPYAWFGGVYKDERMTFAQFATDPELVFAVWDEYKIDPEQLRAWQDDRRGCVVDRRTAARRKWKIGERIPLQGNIYAFDLDLTLRGVFDSPQATDSLWFHWQYLDEGLKQTGRGGSGHAGTIFVKAETTDVVPRLCKSIDDRFANSDNPTRTQTESAFAQMFAEMLGSIETYIRNIGFAVVFSLSLVAANAMAMSLRERTTEIAVLKAIGFQRTRVMFIILFESCLIAVLGGVLGLALGSLFLHLLNGFSPQFFPLSLDELAGLWMVNVIIVAGAIGIISGLLPALRAAQMSVIDGLRRVV